MKHIQRLVSFLLVLVLCTGMIPHAFATEVEIPDAAPSTEETGPTVETTIPETTVPVTENLPESTTPPTIETIPDSTLDTQPEVPPIQEEPGASPPEAAPGGSADYASTQSGILLFDYADNGNYTTVLNYQVSCPYKPNGSGTTRTAYIKNLGWHFARYGGVPYPDDPLYCIEPWRNYGASTSGNSVDRDITVDSSGGTTGSNVWASMPRERREAIGRILLYSDQIWNHGISVTTTKKANNPNVPLRIATQFLIYEIVCGLRDADSFSLNGSNECGTAGDIFYNAGVASVPDFAPNYNTLVSRIQAASQIPSFASRSSSSAPSISLTGNETSVYDSNGVLGNFSISDGSGAEFYKSGNTLYITQVGQIPQNTVFRLSRSVPSANDSSYNIWYMSGSSYQTTISLSHASSGSLNAYFKLKAPSLGNISLRKTTEDGQNLSGWRFGIYTDSSCSTLVSGPHTTNSSGTLSVNGLSAGTYYVKELGHTNSSIEGKYTCASTNPQKVTVTSGSTASVSFHNKLKTGNVQILKETNTGKHLAGWQIGLYYDAKCTQSVAGSPFTTAADGSILVSGLTPGTLYAKEIPGNAPYWRYDTKIKPVIVTAGQTASVSFLNTQLGRIRFQKATNTGNHLGGWTFRVQDENGKVIGRYTTDETGIAYSDYLPLGRYFVWEEFPSDDYWEVKLQSHDVTLLPGEDVVDPWENKELGLGKFYKKTNTGESVEGWHITVYRDDACTDEVGTVTTNAEGYVGYYLEPGIYFAKETGDDHGRFDDAYWLVDERVQKFEIKPHADTPLEFTNVQFGKLKIVKAIEGDGTVEGWQFKITDSKGKAVDGSPFSTDSSGSILTGNLLPGTYTVEEILLEDSLYQCTTPNPQTVTVTQGQTAQVTFTNTLRPGKITVNKIDITGSPLAGAEFLLEWSEDGALWQPIQYADGKTVQKGYCSNPNVSEGCLTSGTDGLLEWGNLYPSLHYRLTETKAPDGYKLLHKPAYEGKLPVDDLAVSVRVTNARTFTMPDTGVSTGFTLRILSAVSGMLCLTMLLYSKKKVV